MESCRSCCIWRRSSACLVADDRPPIEPDVDVVAFVQRFCNREERSPIAREGEQSSGERGFVSLVGAGPGDPELLTLRAVRALRAADVILYDDLVTEPVLDFARREAKRILVGKTGYGPACKQTEINALMVTHAQAGKRVVRLKSGDPMIFGRGGEEIAELRAANVAFEVIPGISAVQAAAARLEVSLTHRDHAKRLQLVTGHSREGKLPENLDWQALADEHATTAVYMARRTLAELSDKLIRAGLPPSTPAFAMIDVTRTSEQIIASTIKDIPAALAEVNAKGPCLVLFGAVLQEVGQARAALVELQP